jgi:hypothetical protein
MDSSRPPGFPHTKVAAFNEAETAGEKPSARLWRFPGFQRCRGGSGRRRGFSPSDLAGGLRDGQSCGWGKPRPFPALDKFWTYKREDGTKKYPSFQMLVGGNGTRRGRNPSAATLRHHQAVRPGARRVAPSGAWNAPEGKSPQERKPGKACAGKGVGEKQRSFM